MSQCDDHTMGGAPANRGSIPDSGKQLFSSRSQDRLWAYRTDSVRRLAPQALGY
jgi:hypothetical protein